jgi:hypothetical protein
MSAERNRLEALWNGKDAILKERLFGLTNSEGNHGEDVKEYYFYLDNTPRRQRSGYTIPAPGKLLVRGQKELTEVLRLRPLHYPVGQNVNSTASTNRVSSSGLKT